MALDERPHHLRLAIRAEGANPALRALDLDQPMDDLPALHQQPMHRQIDAVYILAQLD